MNTHQSQINIRRSAPTVAALLAAFLAIRSEAATIQWNSPLPISADTDVSTAGTLLYAFTFGNTGVPAAMVNGVTFAPFAAPNGGTSAVTVGSATLTLQAGNFYRSTLTETGSASAPFSSLTAAYRGLLQSAVSTGVDPSNTNLTLGGLTIGNHYQLQFWVNESASFTNNLASNTQTILTNGNSATVDSNIPDATGGMGQWVIGNFLANETTQTISIAGGNPAGASPILNGFQIRTVPEPASISFGIISLANNRRRSA